MKELKDARLDRLRKKVMDFAYDNEYNKYIGMEILELDETYSMARMKLRPELLNPYGSAHGGAILSLADMAAGTTASMCGYYVTTVSENLNFLAPGVDTEYIYCECKRLRCGKHLCVLEVKITDEKGTLLDSGEYSFFIGKQAILEDE